MEVLSIPIKKIIISPLNVRASISSQFGDEEDQGLMKNVESVGLIEPIIVRPIGDKYEVVVGSRRFQSVKSSGADSISCVVRELTDEDALDLSLSDNVFTRSVDPVTLGNWLKERLERSDMSLRQYAVKIGKAPSTLSEWMRMTDLHPELQKQVSMGAVPFKLALEIARKDLSTEEQAELASDSQEGGLDSLRRTLDRISAGHEKRGAPKGLLILRINFGSESPEYDTLKKQAEDKGLDLGEYCLGILVDHVRRANT